jgi:phage-related protein
MPITKDNSDSGVTAGVKFVTSTVGNTVGGVTRTVGGVVGAAGRGVGHTITGATGRAGKPVGDGIAGTTTGIENAANNVARGVEDAGRGESGGKYW